MARYRNRPRIFGDVLPELPEVEITRRHLEKAMLGRTLTSVSVSHPRTARFNSGPDEVETRLTGRRVSDLRRHGKFLVATLDDGHTMLAHLGMSGRFSIAQPDTERPLHTHMVATLDDGTEVRFIDPRTFGFVAVYDADELEASALGRLGPDAWEQLPTTEQLARRLEGRTAPIKALLLDQAPMAGLGNIYADEVLFHAGVHPLTPGGALGMARIQALLEAVIGVLSEAIEHEGTTLDDLAYLLPDGEAGGNLDRLSVYARVGLPCRRCGTPIERTVVRGRSSHFCPSCQPE